MNQSEELNLVNGLMRRLNRKPAVKVDRGVIKESERGWSGIEVYRGLAIDSAGATTGIIFKRGELQERRALEELILAKCRYTPASYSNNLLSNQPAWFVQLDLGHQTFPSLANQQWMQKTTTAIATIHAIFLNKSAPKWLPVAGEKYWKKVTSELSLDHFEQKILTNKLLAQEFGKYLPILREKAKEFVEHMDQLTKLQECLTLTHGDIQTVDGAHIYACHDEPRIIDFGFCQYAPFYIDLVTYFTLEEALFYFDVMQSKGLAINKEEFIQHYKWAVPYTGFIYFYPSLMQWSSGPTEKTGKRLLQMISTIIGGDFPERKIAYSNDLFLQLLEKHQAWRSVC